jgi:hypothetical protein
MALKSVLASLDEVGEEFRSLYAEQKVGDKTVYALDIEDVDNHPKVRGVITANRENVRKRDEYKAKAEELEGKLAVLPADFDADEWTRLKAGGGKPDEAIEALKAQHARALDALKAKHAEELSGKDKVIGEREGYINNTIIDGGLKDALLEVGVKPELLDGARLLLREKVKVQQGDDGSRKAIVETDLGEVGIADFVKDWAGTKGKPYLGTASGPDAPGSNARPGSKTMTRADFDKLDPGAQRKAVLTDKITVVD